ncbi:hypothetical protein TH25_07415 [Thalassospira profundimaris]|uniref:Uncharacterized protein n=1 Tax=Thalassospira profundimaris TaxID=502049 RepID=A0A367XF58_9PROT|nr:hypothetical protein [Thalassospira profundimaris]RCK52325.1 hypothetical protein TH25_07415 [Thalassospira profundimaris]
MKTLSRNIAIVALAFGVSALAMTPAIASAAENSTYAAIVPNNHAGPHGARKEHDIWLAQNPETASNQNAAPQVSHEIVPNNTAGAHGARKEHDIWLASHPETPYNPNTVQQANDQIVPNNTAGAHGARKEHDIWLAKQAASAQSNVNNQDMTNN